MVSRNLPDLIDRVRGSVVQIVVGPKDPNAEVPADLGLQCFIRKECVIGTGFFVNTDGDVVTASHVASDAAKVIARLASRNLEAIALILAMYPNSEGKSGGQIAWNEAGFQVALQAEDKAHDIAVVSPLRGLNPFDRAKQVFNIGDQGFNLKAARLDVGRPRDGEDVFACGFPLGAEALTTTIGHVATSWGKENLHAARESGISEESDVYRLDLRANFGNSGGPVFRNSDQSVIGITVEVTPGIGGTAVVVPSRYIADLLKKNNIRWSSSPSPSPN